MTTEIKKSYSDDCYQVEYPVLEEHESLRLDQFMMEKLPTFSRQNIKKKIASKEILILGRDAPHRPSSKVHFGETVKMITYKNDLEDEYWNGEKIELQKAHILKQTEDYFILSKPAFMTTHPTGKRLFNVATVYLETHSGSMAHSVHRLDRETSGVMVFARNKKSAQLITTEFENTRVKKAYFFIAHKKENSTPFPFTAYERLERLEPRQLMKAHSESSELGKHAKTDFHLLYESEQYVLALAFPKTGRQHQIRVHAAYHGYPLLGDKIYHGGYKMFQRFKDRLASEQDHNLMQIPRQALHAISLSFSYEGNENIFIDHIPQDLKDWIEQNLICEIKGIESKISEIIQTQFKISSK